MAIFRFFITVAILHLSIFNKKLSYRTGTARRIMLVWVWELERFHTAKVTFKVIPAYWQWCHWIGHIPYDFLLVFHCNCACIMHR